MNCPTQSVRGQLRVRSESESKARGSATVISLRQSKSAREIRYDRLAELDCKCLRLRRVLQTSELLYGANLTCRNASVQPRGRSLRGAGNLVEAEDLCQQVVAARPHFADAFHLLGLAQSSLGKVDAALANYDRAIGLRPDFARAHHNRGILLEKIGRYHEALASYDRALSVRPDFAMALSNRGNVLHHLRRLPEALESYGRAVQLQPDFAMAHYNRGRVLQDLNRQEQALASYDCAIASQPQFAEAFSNRGNVLLELNRLTEAVASYDRAVDIRPDFPQAFSNRGSALEKLARYDEAVASFDRAIALKPDYSDARSNRGIVLAQLQRFDDALADFAGAVAASPSNAEAHFGEAEVRLLRADFDRGWKEYEWRQQAQQLRHSQRNFARPLWLGENEITGKTILLHAEQGLGDTIQFCRYVPLVGQRGAHANFLRSKFAQGADEQSRRSDRHRRQ